MRSAVAAAAAVGLAGVLDTTGENASTDVLVLAIAAVATAAAEARALRRFAEGIVRCIWWVIRCVYCVCYAGLVLEYGVWSSSVSGSSVVITIVVQTSRGDGMAQSVVIIADGEVSKLVDSDVIQSFFLTFIKMVRHRRLHK
jgi:hypothetical protein